MQSDRVLIERLDVSCKANAIHEKYGHQNAFFAQRIEKFILECLTLISHILDCAPRMRR
jgi:hypothetical protein